MRRLVASRRVVPEAKHDAALRRFHQRPPVSASISALSPIQVALNGTGPSTWIVALQRLKTALDALKGHYKLKQDDYRQIFTIMRGADAVPTRRLCMEFAERYDFVPDPVTMKILISIKGCATAPFMRHVERRYLEKHRDPELELSIAARDGQWEAALKIFASLNTVEPDPFAAKKVVRALGKAQMWLEACSFAADFSRRNPSASADVRLTSDVFRTLAEHPDNIIPLQFCALLRAQGHELGAENVATLAQLKGSPPPEAQRASSPGRVEFWEEAIRLFVRVPPDANSDAAAAPTLLKAMQRIDYYHSIPREHFRLHMDIMKTGTANARAPVPIVPPFRIFKQWREHANRLFRAFLRSHPLGSVSVMAEPWMFFLAKKSSEGTIVVLDTNFVLWMLAHGVKNLDRITPRVFHAYPFLKQSVSCVLVPFTVYRELCGLLFNAKVKSKSRWRHRLLTLLSNPNWHVVHLAREMELHAFTFIPEATGRHFETDPDKKINALLLLMQYYLRAIAVASMSCDTSPLRTSKFLAMFARYHMNRVFGSLQAATLRPANSNVVFLTFDKGFSATCDSLGIITFPTFRLSEKGAETAAGQKQSSSLGVDTSLSLASIAKRRPRNSVRRFHTNRTPIAPITLPGYRSFDQKDTKVPVFFDAKDIKVYVSPVPPPPASAPASHSSAASADADKWIQTALDAEVAGEDDAADDDDDGGGEDRDEEDDGDAELRQAAAEILSAARKK